MKKIIVLYSLLTLVNNVFSQDFHLSQFDAQQLYLNPALTGQTMNEDWGIRANAHYREQWTKLNGGPYATVSAGFDLPLLGQKFGIGQYIINNKGYNGNFNTFNLIFSAAYKITHADAQNIHNLSTGLQLGLLQNTFNPGKFVFDEQYTPYSINGFDSNLPSGENFQRVSYLNFDANMGIFYKYMHPGKKYAPFFGCSLYHINQANQSFSSTKFKTPMRINFNAGFDLQLNEQMRLNIQTLYTTQAKANDLNVCVLYFLKTPFNNIEPMIGGAWRKDDAIIIHTGIKQLRYFFRISYDISTSYLSKYNGNKGGLEFSLIYTGKL